MKPVIAVDGVSKRYVVRAAGSAGYRTLREKLTEGAAGYGRRLFRRASPRRGRTEAAPPAGDAEFYALRDVSFEVRPGEVLGVVGRNGAGKSTLLKVLSRITPPSDGSIRLRGRVGSLLEVGTGFHPELTGRENIYLNGAILGMARAEIQRKFDEIVAFSEVEKFLETPVKRYSSGMYMKLAFAVASHLEPEILLVDEVLAVGDAQFQKKCLGKMNEVSKHGRTVLFVSHNMPAVKGLCSRAILVDGGRIAADGDVDEVVNRYLSAGTDMARTGIIPDAVPRHQDVAGEARFRSVRMTDLAGAATTQLYFHQPFRLEVECDVLKDIPDGHVEVSVSTTDGLHVLYATTMDGGRAPMELARGTHRVTVEFDNPLLPRQYTIDLGLHHQNGTTADFVSRCLDFDVLRVAEAGGDHYQWPRTRGLVRGNGRWEMTAGGAL
jgi:lipopolysaccharide transport system ATP-binding protein